MNKLHSHLFHPFDGSPPPTKAVIGRFLEPGARQIVILLSAKAVVVHHPHGELSAVIAPLSGL
ncbi:hypothetical protein D3C84_983520 [compost metagenome]